MFEKTKMKTYTNVDPVAKWMTKEVIYIRDNETVSRAIDILDNHTIFGIPVVDEEHRFLGLMSKTVIMNYISNSSVFNLPVSQIMLVECETIHPESSIDEASGLKGGCLPVVDEAGRLVGIITRTDIIRANAFRLDEAKEQVDYAETLKLVLNSAYEGVVVVNSDGYIQEINESYCRIINRRREEVLGRNVVEVIENTRLDVIAKTGREERGHIQRIAGQDLVVHRIPIFQNKRPVGAIGMLVFKDISEMNVLYNRINVQKHQSKERQRLKQQASILDAIIGQSSEIKAAKKRAAKAAACSSNVFITGASGTGKEVFAKAIHEMSTFSEGKFICVNCSAIPESLLESELFGYEEGAFTDAKRGGKLGKFELADKGTIFLDEIGDMPFSMQAKLLRVIQERTIERVGSTEQKRVNVRIITATHRDLKKMVEEGTFREDLYYRINVISLKLPSLAERKEDISLFLTKGIEEFVQQFGFERKQLSSEATACLEAYHWPGNIRHLLNVCESLVALTDGPLIGVNDLPIEIQEYYYEQTMSLNEAKLSKVEQQEKELIRKNLLLYNGNKTLVSKELGIPRSTFYEKIKKYELV